MGVSNKKSGPTKVSKQAAAHPVKKAQSKTAINQSVATDSKNQGAILRSILDSFDTPVFSIDNNYRYTSYNKVHASLMKTLYGADIQIGKIHLDYITDKADRKKAKANLGRVLLKGEPVSEESFFGEKQLSRRFLEIFHSPVIDAAGGIEGVVVVARDITERKQLESQCCRQAEDLSKRAREMNCLYGLSMLIEEKDNSPEDIFKDAVALIPDACQYPEITCARLVMDGKEYTTPNWRETACKLSVDIRVGGATFGRLEICYLKQMPDCYKGPFLKEECDLANAIAQRLGRMVERKQAEEAILRSRLLLQNVIDSTPDFMYVKDFEHRYIMVNLSFARSQNLTPEEMMGRLDTDFFAEELCFGNHARGIAGFHADDDQALQGHFMQNPGNVITWADGSTHVYDTFKIPLTDQHGKIYGVLVYSRESIERHAEGHELIDRAMQRTLQAVINMITSFVEARDPSTAGHQRRVAALSEAIAREMKLDESRIEDLVMAAKIHDIGKMYVPANILNKQGKLTDIEFSMVITHAQESYNILWKADFAQTVAQIVLQHHERIDGSGYPNELKGDQMLTESKILAVADVVEAISSNRPYRQVFGVDNALEEISKNRSKLYDTRVVDACVKLFIEKRFTFQD